MYIDVKKNSPKPDEVVLFKKHIAYYFEKRARSDPETMCLVLFDMSGATVHNVVRVCVCVCACVCVCVCVWGTVRGGRCDETACAGGGEGMRGVRQVDMARVACGDGVGRWGRG